MIVWWPFFALFLVLIALAAVTYRKLSWRAGPWEAINTIAALITAAAAISIPLVIDRNSRDTRTLEQLNDLDRRLSEALDRKDDLDKSNQKTKADRFRYLYIIENEKHKLTVYKILNESPSRKG